jgi:DNA-binding beta-propeller fold protein YncE
VADGTQPVSSKVRTGSAPLEFETLPGWGTLQNDAPVGPTHGGVAVDAKGTVYVSTDSADGIRVFSEEGKWLRNMAPEFSGSHSLMIREENGEEFLYGAHVKGARAFKMKLDGTPVLTIPFPVEANLYGEKGEGYKPTAVAVGPDGAIFVADGYGKSVIHKYDASGKYIKTFGGKGNTDGKFNTCHGLALDTRFEKPLLLVCDRANRRLQHYDFDGNFVATLITDLRLPCAVSIRGDLVAVAELEGRVLILDKTHKIVSTLGDNPEKKQRANFGVAPSDWRAGIFTAPHGLSWDLKGNLIVQDWNKTGRLTMLKKLQ